MENTLFLVCRIGETWLGLPATKVEAVVTLGDVVAVPHAPDAVRGLVSIRSRLLTLIDSSIASGTHSDGTASYMVIVSVDGHGYGLTLDEVDDVVDLTSLQPVPGNLGFGWRLLADQMADQFGRIILIVEPSRIIEAAQSSKSMAA